MFMLSIGFLIFTILFFIGVFYIIFGNEDDIIKLEMKINNFIDTHWEQFWK